MQVPPAVAAVPGWTVTLAMTPWARLRGLLGRRTLAADHGLWLGVRSVHTIGMRFPLDLVWVAANGRVLRIDSRVAPGHVRGCRRASGGVIEVAADCGPAFAAALARSVG